MLTYSPGSWRLVVAGSGAALLPPDLEEPVLARIWASMRAGDAFAAVLGALVESVGADMANLPAFAVVTVQGTQARVIVRGAVQARVVTGDGSLVPVGELGVPTWTDRTVDDPDAVLLTVAGDAETLLPLRDGVVAAAALRWQIGAGEPVAPAIRPQAVAAAAPPPAPPPAPPAPPPVPTSPASVEALDDPAVSDVPAVSDAPAPPDETGVPDEPALPEAPALADETAFPDVGGTFATLGDVLAPPIEETSTYDDLLFGATRMSTVEDAAVRAPVEDAPHPPAGGLISAIPPPSAPAPPSPPASTPEGDHDGETVTPERAAELQARLAALPSNPDAAAPAAAGTRAPAALLVSTGERVVLDRNVMVGVNPRAIRATGVLPHLVTVPSPNKHISRNHVELRVEGSDVIAVDLNATNGTFVLRPGADPERLHPNEPTLMVTGDRLDLGDGVILSFEGV